MDLPVLEAFLQELAQTYNRTADYVLKSLIAGVVGTSYVLVERAGGQLPKVGPAWDELRYQYEHSMPQRWRDEVCRRPRNVDSACRLASELATPMPI